MSEREALEGLLDLVDTRNGDDWADECCRYCHDEPWHRGRYGEGVGVVTGDDIWRPAVAKCACACHDARRLLGREDKIHDPRWQAPAAV